MVLSTISWNAAVAPSGGDWDTPGNWVGGKVPVAGDSAMIQGLTAGVVTHGKAISDEVGQVTADGSATLQISAGTLTIDSGSSLTTLTVNGGNLAGLGNLTVSGLMTFNGGTMSGTGTTDAQGGLSIRGGTLDGRTLLNEANAALGGASTILLLTDGAVLDNRAGATFDVTDDSSIVGIAGQPNNGGKFLNEGTFAKTGGQPNGLSAITAAMTQSGAGTTEFQAGRLRFQYDASFSGTGAVTVDAGADLRFQGGTYTFAASSGLVGGGTVEFLGGTVNDAGSYNITGATLVNGGDAELTGPIASIGPSPVINGTLNLKGNNPLTLATLTTSGTFNDNGPLTVTGLTTMNGGSMSGTGTTDAQGGLSIRGGTLDGRTLLNEANATLGGASTILLLTDGAVLDNRAGATLNVTDDSSIFGIAGQPNNGGKFLNEGTFAKTGGQPNGLSGITVPMTQSGAGTTEFQAGRLRFQYDASFSGTGAVTVDAGADLRFQGGTYTFAASSGLVGGGTVEFLGGTVNDAGSYNITGATLVNGGDAELTGPVLGLGSALTVGVGTLNLSGGVPVSLGSASVPATFAMSGGSLTGKDSLAIYGSSSWSGGTMAGTGITDIYSNIAMGGTTPGVGYNEAIDGRRVNLRFGGTFSGGVGGAIYLSDGAILDNGVGNTDAEFTIYNNASILSLGGTPSGGTFLNEGELDVNYITGTGTCTIAVPLVQSGLALTSVLGTLRLYGGSSTDSSEFGLSPGSTLQFYTGTYNITSQYGIAGTGTVDFHGGTVNDSGPYDVTGTTTVTGGDAELTGAVGPFSGASTIGSLSITSGTFNYASNLITVQAFTQSGGTLTGSSSMVVLGPLLWSGGTMSGTGTTIAGSSLTIGGSVAGTSYSEVLDRRTLENDGVATLGTGASGGLYLSDGAVLRNANNSLTLLGNVSIIAFGGTPSGGTVVNQASLIMAGPGKSVVSVPLDNQIGNIHVQSGTLSLTGGLANSLSGSTLVNGSYQLEGTLQFPNANIVTNATYLDLDGPGAKILDGNGLNALRNFAANTGQLVVEGSNNLALTGALANSGRLSIVGGSTTLSASNFTQSGGTTELDGGTLSASGGVAINGGTLQGFGTVVGNLSNASTVQPGNAVVGGILIDTGVLTVSGNYTQAASGSLKIEIEGTTVGTQYDQLAVSGQVALGGTLSLSLTNGWMPGGSDQYSVLTYGSRSGQFATTLGALDGTVLLSPGFSTTDPSQAGALNLAVTLDSTSAFSISQSGFSFNRFTGQMTQVVTITNNGTSAFIGPISLVLEQLSGATLVSSTGTTSTALDSGNPYISLIPTGGSLLPGQSLTFKLVFKPTGTISYTLRLLTGLGPR